jgi:hypothetical protein
VIQVVGYIWLKAVNPSPHANIGLLIGTYRDQTTAENYGSKKGFTKMVW